MSVEWACLTGCTASGSLPSNADRTLLTSHEGMLLIHCKNDLRQCQCSTPELIVCMVQSISGVTVLILWWWCSSARYSSTQVLSREASVILLVAGSSSAGYLLTCSWSTACLAQEKSPCFSQPHDGRESCGQLVTTQTARGIDGGYQLYPFQPHPLKTVVIETIICEHLVREKKLVNMTILEVTVIVVMVTRGWGKWWWYSSPAVGRQWADWCPTCLVWAGWDPWETVWDAHSLSDDILDQW